VRLLRAFRSRPYGPMQLPTAGAFMAGIGVTVAAAAGGWALASHLTSEPSAEPSARPTIVRLSPNAEFSLRTGWQRIEKVPAVPGFASADTQAFAPTDGGAGRMVTALLPAASVVGLPKDTAKALRTPLSRASQRTTVGGIRGSGYTALALKGVDGIVDVYTVPTVAGVFAVACVAPLDDPLPVGTCPEDILAVAVRKPVVDDPLAALRSRLPGVVSSLNRARRDGRKDLREGATSKAQARAAARLAVAYRAAATRVAAVAPETGTPSTLAASFTGAAAAYDALEKAAQRHSKRSWHLARVKVVAAENAAKAKLNEVRAG
jgi:hypothetical protein